MNRRGLLAAAIAACFPAMPASADDLLPGVPATASATMPVWPAGPIRVADYADGGMSDSDAFRAAIAEAQRRIARGRCALRRAFVERICVSGERDWHVGGVVIATNGIAFTGRS